jgi:hypothetical protein
MQALKVSLEHCKRVSPARRVALNEPASASRPKHPQKPLLSPYKVPGAGSTKTPFRVQRIQKVQILRVSMSARYLVAMGRTLPLALIVKTPRGNPL